MGILCSASHFVILLLSLSQDLDAVMHLSSSCGCGSELVEEGLQALHARSGRLHVAKLLQQTRPV